MKNIEENKTTFLNRQLYGSFGLPVTLSIQFEYIQLFMLIETEN